VPQDVFEIPEPQQELSVRERALKIFSKIEGLDDIKEMMLRALESPERAHTLLTGPPPCAKFLQLQIEKFMPSKVYFKACKLINNYISLVADYFCLLQRILNTP
jgi:hypothetical protein